MLITAVLSLTLALSIHAGNKTKSSRIDCATGSLASAISKLDRSTSNVIEFTGDCVEDIVVEGHRDLKLIGTNAASITATVYDIDDQFGSTVALSVSRSNITVESVTLNGGAFAAKCDNRSVCVFRDVAMLRGFEALAVQSQSAVDIYGSLAITGNGVGFTGIGIYGASAVNIRPHWLEGYDPDELGYTLSGYYWGVLVQDGSFFRSDNLVVTGNADIGVKVQRGATAKLLSGSALPGIHGNGGWGVNIMNNSAAQVITPISGNGGADLAIGALSSVQARIDSSTIVDCYDDTARSNACPAE